MLVFVKNKSIFSEEFQLSFLNKQYKRPKISGFLIVSIHFKKINSLYLQICL